MPYQSRTATTPLATGPLVVGLVAFSVVLMSPSTTHATTVPVRYASPGGSSSNPCRPAKPCDIATAINDAPSHSTIILRPGKYGTPTDQLSTPLEDANTRTHLRIEGPASGHRATIYSSGVVALDLNNDSSVSHLAVVSTGSLGGLALYTSSADHVSVSGVSPEFGTCGVDDATLSDSQCVATGPTGDAIEMKGYADETAMIRGVTAVATGAGGSGAEIDVQGVYTMSMTVTNSILVGAGGDATVGAATGGTATIIARHSDIQTSTKRVSGGVETVSTDGTDTSAAPKFMNTTTGDYREKVGSPTINAGAHDPSTDRDLAGRPRTLGSAPDMGAFEFLQRPTLSALKLNHQSVQSVTASARVNGEGLPTKVTVVLTHHGHRVEAVTSRGSDRHKGRVHLSILHLKSGRTYRVYAVASNAGGHVRSATKRVKR